MLTDSKTTFQIKSDPKSILSQAKHSIQTTNVVQGHMCYMTVAGLPIFPESARFLLNLVPEMAFCFDLSWGLAKGKFFH